MVIKINLRLEMAINGENHSLSHINICIYDKTETCIGPSSGWVTPEHRAEAVPASLSLTLWFVWSARWRMRWRSLVVSVALIVCGYESWTLDRHSILQQRSGPGHIRPVCPQRGADISRTSSALLQSLFCSLIFLWALCYTADQNRFWSHKTVLSIFTANFLVWPGNASLLL